MYLSFYFLKFQPLHSIAAFHFFRQINESQFESRGRGGDGFFICTSNRVVALSEIMEK